MSAAKLCRGASCLLGARWRPRLPQLGIRGPRSRVAWALSPSCAANRLPIAPGSCECSECSLTTEGALVRPIRSRLLRMLADDRRSLSPSDPIKVLMGYGTAALGFHGELLQNVAYATAYRTVEKY